MCLSALYGLPYCAGRSTPAAPHPSTPHSSTVASPGGGSISLAGPRRDGLACTLPALSHQRVKAMSTRLMACITVVTGALQLLQCVHDTFSIPEDNGKRGHGKSYTCAPTAGYQMLPSEAEGGYRSSVSSDCKDGNCRRCCRSYVGEKGTHWPRLFSSFRYLYPEGVRR